MSLRQEFAAVIAARAEEAARQREHAQLTETEQREHRRQLIEQTFAPAFAAPTHAPAEADAPSDDLDDLMEQIRNDSKENNR